MGGGGGAAGSAQHQGQDQQQQQHSQKTTSSFRRLSDFIFEDPATYTQSEVRVMLDMINDGTGLTTIARLTRAPPASASPPGGRRAG